MPLFFRRAFPGGPGRGPGDLQIEAAGIGIAVDDLSGEEKPGKNLTFHGFRVNFRNLDAAGGDDRLRHRPLAGDINGEGFQQLHQLPPLLLRKAVGLEIVGNIQPVQYHRDHGPGKQIRQRVLHGPVLVHIQIPQDPCVTILNKKNVNATIRNAIDILYRNLAFFKLLISSFFNLSNSK